MSLLLKQIFALFKLLNSETGTNQIAAGFACGMILGFAPFFSLQTALVLVVIFFFRVQFGAAMLTSFFFKLFSYALDPAFDIVGQRVLEMAALEPLFVTLYGMPLVPLTRFYNSIAMGSMVVSLVLTPFAFVLARILIKKYRVTVVARFKASRAWKGLEKTSLYKWYYNYEELYGR